MTRTVELSGRVVAHYKGPSHPHPHLLSHRETHGRGGKAHASAKATARAGGRFWRSSRLTVSEAETVPRLA